MLLYLTDTKASNYTWFTFLPKVRTFLLSLIFKNRGKPPFTGPMNVAQVYKIAVWLFNQQLMPLVTELVFVYVGCLNTWTSLCTCLIGTIKAQVPLKVLVVGMGKLTILPESNVKDALCILGSLEILVAAHFKRLAKRLNFPTLINPYFL